MVRLDRQKYWLIGAFLRLGREAREVDVDVDRGQRRGDHEDDQQHQNDVDERRDVDFMDVGELLLTVIKTYAHPDYSAGSRVAIEGARLRSAGCAISRLVRLSTSVLVLANSALQPAIERAR